MSVVFVIRCRYYHYYYYYFLFYSSCLFPSVISCVCLFQLVTFIFFIFAVCVFGMGRGGVGEGTAGHMTSGLVWYLWGLGMGKGELT